jgi:hypothetical protein
MLGLFFEPEDGSDTFLRNVGGLSTDCTTLYPRRWNAFKILFLFFFLYLNKLCAVRNLHLLLRVLL